MSSQVDIFGGETPLAPGVRLGRNQQQVYTALRQRKGITADEAGAIVHADRGRHPEDRRCNYCAEAGKGVLRSLRAHGLVVHRRSLGEWRLAGDRSGPRNPAPAIDGPGELPEGY